MSWTEFLLRVFGWLAALVLLLGLKAIWDNFAERRRK
jgi:hypothetical protein